MINSRFSKNRGKKLHETFLQVIHSKKTSYEELLRKV